MASLGHNDLNSEVMWDFAGCHQPSQWCLAQKRILSLYSLIQTPSCDYMNSHYKPNRVWRSSQVYNGNPYTNKTVSSQWKEAQILHKIKGGGGVISNKIENSNKKACFRLYFDNCFKPHSWRFIGSDTLTIKQVVGPRQNQITFG